MVLRKELDFNKDSDKWIFFKSYPYGKEVNENMLLAGDILCVSKSFDGSIYQRLAMQSNRKR